MMDSRGRIGILTHYRDGRISIIGCDGSIMTYDDIVAHKKNNCSEYPLY